MARLGGRLHRPGGIAKTAAKRPSPSTAALTRRRTVCTSATWCRCWRCAAFNCWGIIPSPWPAARPAPSAIPAARPPSASCSARRRSTPTSRASKTSCAACWISTPPPIPPACWTTRTGPRRVSFLDFLRDIGKHFSVNQMVAKESVRARMEDREAGISYTEFSYMLLQAFDFYHPAPRTQLRTANRRHATNGATSPPALTSSARNSARGVYGPHPAAHHQRRRHQIRQNRRRRHLARRRQNQRLSLLPVLDPHRRPRRRALPEISSPFSASEEIAALAARARRPARSPRRAQGAGQGDDRSDPRPVRHRRGRARQRDSFRRRPGRHFRTDVQRNRRRNPLQGN